MDNIWIWLTSLLVMTNSSLLKPWPSRKFVSFPIQNGDVNYMGDFPAMFDQRVENG